MTQNRGFLVLSLAVFLWVDHKFGVFWGSLFFLGWSLIEWGLAQRRKRPSQLLKISTCLAAFYFVFESLFHFALFPLFWRPWAMVVFFWFLILIGVWGRRPYLFRLVSEGKGFSLGRNSLWRVRCWAALVCGGALLGVSIGQFSETSFSDRAEVYLVGGILGVSLVGLFVTRFVAKRGPGS